MRLPGPAGAAAVESRSAAPDEAPTSSNAPGALERQRAPNPNDRITMPAAMASARARPEKRVFCHDQRLLVGGGRDGADSGSSLAVLPACSFNWIVQLTPTPPKTG